MELIERGKKEIIILIYRPRYIYLSSLDLDVYTQDTKQMKSISK